jgi:Ribbon-helix-helix protein, copG family
MRDRRHVFAGVNEPFCKPKEKVMGAMKENPRYNVVSIRVSDDELEVLQEVSKETRKSISQIMREAMSLIQSNGETAGLSCLTS